MEFIFFNNLLRLLLLYDVKLKILSKMKKKQQAQKKLSLNKIQLTKINNPKIIKGGNVNNQIDEFTKTHPTETK